MTYLLDTNACIHFLNDGGSAIARRIFEAGPDLLGLSSLSVAELHFGAARSSRPAANRRRVETLCRELPVADFDLACAAHFGRLKADLASRGRPIPDLDLAIAATALCRGATLVTADGHFAAIEGLSVEDWAS